MSTVSESNPWCAMTSAENALGMESQPLTTFPPRFQIVRSVFSRMGRYLPLPATRLPAASSARPVSLACSSTLGAQLT